MHKREYIFDKVVPVRVVDGDTFYLEVDLGFHVKVTESFRLKGIDTPEIYRPRNEAELKHGQDAKKFVEELFFNEKNHITLKSHKSGLYGRWEAEVIIEKEDGSLHDLAQLLRDAGLEKLESYE